MDFSAWGGLLTHWPFDWILIGALVAFAALDAMRSGSTRAASLTLSLPVSLLLLQELPKAFLVGPLASPSAQPIQQLVIFLLIAAAMYVAAHKMIFTFSNGTGPVQALVTGLAATIVLVIVWLQVPALQTVWHFGPQVGMVFGAAYRFWWLLGSYAALAFVRS